MCDWIFICIIIFLLHTTGLLLLLRTSFSIFGLKQEGISRGKTRTSLQPGPLFIYFPEAAWKIPKTTREYTAASIIAANLLTFKTLSWATLRICIHNLDPYPLQMQHCSPFKKILYMNAALSLAAPRQTPLHRKLAGISQLILQFKFSSCVPSTQISLAQLWMSSSPGSGRNGAARISNNQFKINGWL